MATFTDISDWQIRLLDDLCGLTSLTARHIAEKTQLSPQYVAGYIRAHKYRGKKALHFRKPSEV